MDFKRGYFRREDMPLASENTGSGGRGAGRGYWLMVICYLRAFAWIRGRNELGAGSGGGAWSEELGARSPERTDETRKLRAES